MGRITEENFMEAVLIAVPLAFLITFGIVFLLYKKHMKALDVELEKRVEFNGQIDAELSEKEFLVSKTLYLLDNQTVKKSDNHKKRIYIDSEKNNIAFVDYDANKLHIVQMRDLLSYEIYENGSTVTDGVGGYGYYVGGFTTEKVEKCKDLRIIFKLNSLDNSMVAYDIVSNDIFTGISKTSTTYSACIKSLQQVTAFFDIIIENNKKAE